MESPLTYSVATAIFTLVSGALLGKVGYYQLFLVLGGILITIGSGLIYTLDIGSSTGKYIGYQILVGIGDGLAVQVPVTACQALSKPVDIPAVTATVLCECAPISLANNFVSFASEQFHTSFLMLGNKSSSKSPALSASLRARAFSSIVSLHIYPTTLQISVRIWCLMWAHPSCVKRSILSRFQGF